MYQKKNMQACRHTHGRFPAMEFPFVIRRNPLCSARLGECLLFSSHASFIMIFVPSGCSSVLARVLAWGARGRTFESCHSDHTKKNGFQVLPEARFFMCFDPNAPYMCLDGENRISPHVPRRHAPCGTTRRREIRTLRPSSAAWPMSPPFHPVRENAQERRPVPCRFR